MVKFFKIGKKDTEEYIDDSNDDYLSINELNTVSSSDNEEKLVNVKVFVLDDYDNIREILDVIRGEDTICLIDIHLLRNKDPDELRRAIDKLKKTVSAVDGELVGFNENWILSAPKNVQVHKGKN